ncbi:MAG: pyruvate dehydrogenase (acetyl-transferring), homodimeric type, partial [Proteobacteria bacterium]
LTWAAGDMQARWFLVGGTAGRTTLAGEGLQHQDGHSQILASTVPNCVSYDPAFAYELAVIIQDGLRRMYAEHENVYYYITCMNENYAHPPMPEGAQKGILRGMHRLSKASRGSRKKPRVNLLGSGTILREVIAAAELLKEDFDVDSDIWSVTSFNELAREGRDAERHNMLHPGGKPKTPYVTSCLSGDNSPVVAATDYICAFADQIRQFIPQRYSVLGTDGFGRSDTRSNLRHYFEVDRYYVALAAMKALADEELVPVARVKEAIKKYEIDVNKPNPRIA